MRPSHWFLLFSFLLINPATVWGQVMVNPYGYGFPIGGIGFSARLGHHGGLTLGGVWPMYGGYGMGTFYRQNTIIYAPTPYPYYVPVPYPVGVPINPLINPLDGPLDLQGANRPNALNQQNLMQPNQQAAVPRMPMPEKRPQAPAQQPAKDPKQDKPKDTKPRPEAKPVMPAGPLPLPPQPQEPSRDGVEESQRQLLLGKKAFEEREYGKAAGRFQQAANLDPGQPEALFLLGQAQIALGKYLDAYEAIMAGLILNPERASASFRTRDLYGDHPEEATEHLEQLRELVKQNEKDAVLLFLYGYGMWFDGQREKGRECLQKAQAGLPVPGIVEGFLRPLTPPGKGAEGDR